MMKLRTGLRKIAKISGLREIAVLKETGVDKQRIYDAMLIKAFRKDIRMTDLERWLKPYDIKLLEDGLKRVPKHIFWPGRVQEMVGRYMKQLADRLWDTDLSKDIETLNWMSNIECDKAYRKWDYERNKLKRDSNNARRKTKLLANAIENDANKASNQWKIVK